MNLLLESNLITSFTDLFERILGFFQTSGILILKVLLFFILGIFAIKIIMKILEKVFSKTKIEHAIYVYILKLIKIVLSFILILTLLNMLGIDTTSLLAVLTTISLALSLAMENIFSNLANGIVLIMTKPFKEGDWININGNEGSVKSIKLLYTVLTTADNKDINIPNSTFIGGELTNYNANPTRKVIMTFDTSYDSDVDKVKEIIKNCIYSNDLALLDPEPVVRLKALNASSLQFQAIIVCKTSDYWSVYYDTLDRVFNEFKKQGISVPFNQLEVRLLNNDSKTPYRNDPLPVRTNDGKFNSNIVEEDIIDKIAHLSNPIHIAKVSKEKLHERHEKNIEKKNIKKENKQNKKEKKKKKKNNLENKQNNN